MNIDESKKAVQKLLDKYNNIAKNKKYNEEMTKKDFILPLFRALGWATEDSNEVSAEEKISKGRVDYSFRINGIAKFFLEAKSLRENLDNPKFVEQAINYAWFKGCTWAVLTNFECVRIFNAEWKTTNLAQSHLKTIPCDEFLTRFGELWLLSKESFMQGLLDKEAERWGKRTKRTPVDKQLLADFTRFRELLSKNVTKLNRSKNLTEEDLDEAVQRTLDRLIFIRNCEDRQLEEPLLKSMLNVWEKKGKGLLAKGLRQIFAHYNKNYNSKIFADHLCDRLDIDDDVIREIINGLYSTQDKNVSYDFSAIEADVLGNIYEQYLGHILKKTATRAKLAESHSHRKEQGIYYTPTYIVDYIVRNTLGELLEDKNLDVENIRILDPACGSGSFLIKAFDLFNEYHKKYSGKYSQQQIDIEHGTDLPYNTKIKILEKNIFGVDLDKQAVEIAQLNLLLKIAERGQRLPLLHNNIKCGNSLIDDPDVAGNKAFRWEKEFPEVMKEGGFDVVIGNPPYVQLQKNKGELANLYETAGYEVFDRTGDIYCLFIEKAIKLLKPYGYLGFIVSNKWMRAGYGKKLRKFLSRYNPIKIIDLGPNVFESATVDTCIIIVQKSENKNVLYGAQLNEKIQDISDFFEKNKVKLPNFGENTWFIGSSAEQRLKEKIERIGKPLKEWDVNIYRGVLTGLNEAFIITTEKRNEILANCKDEAERQRTEALIKPILRGRDIKRYYYEWAGLWVIVIPAGWTKKVTQSSLIEDEAEKEVTKLLPSLMKHLLPYKAKAQKRDDQGDYWWELRQCAYYPEFEKEKVVYSEIVRQPQFYYDTQNFYVEATSFLMTGEYVKYICGLLNSAPVTYFFKQWYAGGGLGEEGYRYKKAFLENLPLPPITPQNQEIVKKIESLVDKMLSLNKRLDEIGDKKTDEGARIEDEIKETAKEIDALVYQIYGLTEEEIKIVEGEL